jgi:ABC-type glycerol-3-phosphate transport system substrate-binding protein
MVAGVVALLGCGCARGPADGRVHITYWEKWSGFEADAMRAVVARFNAAQTGIVVEFTSISGIARKLLTATAGGNPPDLAGIWSSSLPSYAEHGALVPLDGYVQRAGITSNTYVPVYWRMCQYRGHTWALPSTPGSTALIYNKTLFRRAGLDPERPPRTMAELDAYAAKLTVYDAHSNIVQLGFLPTEPGWYNFAWIHYFGGAVWDETNKITYATPAGRAMFDWIAAYSRRYGVKAVQQFSAGFGNFASPQNAFLAGKVAMELQGVWMHNFIEKYAPGLDWGAAPFPAVDGIEPPVVYTEADVLVIPRGSPHPDAAFAFIRFVQEQTNMELLCRGQLKASPLAQVCPTFFATHPHPYLPLFYETTFSPRAFTTPAFSIHEEMVREVNVAIDGVRLLRLAPDDAAALLQSRGQRALNRMLAQRARRGENILPEAP